LCQAWPTVAGISIVVIGVSVDLIQLLRVRAIYKANRRVTFPLYLFFGGVFLAAIIAIAMGSSNPNSTVPAQTMYVIGCVDNHNNAAALAGWIAEMALGGVFFLLTVLKLHPYLWRRRMHTPFLTAVVEGGLVFYIVIFAVEMLNTIFVQLMSASSRMNLLNITEPWAIAVYGIAGPRLVLHLRGVMTSFVDVDDVTPVRAAGETELVASQANRHAKSSTRTISTATTGSFTV